MSRDLPLLQGCLWVFFHVNPPLHFRSFGGFAGWSGLEMLAVGWTSAAFHRVFWRKFSHRKKTWKWKKGPLASWSHDIWNHNHTTFYDKIMTTMDFFTPYQWPFYQKLLVANHELLTAKTVARQTWKTSCWSPLQDTVPLAWKAGEMFGSSWHRSRWCKLGGNPIIILPKF